LNSIELKSNEMEGSNRHRGTAGAHLRYDDSRVPRHASNLYRKPWPLLLHQLLQDSSLLRAQEWHVFPPTPLLQPPQDPVIVHLQRKAAMGSFMLHRAVWSSS
jgi:hypothetical protein